MYSPTALQAHVRAAIEPWTFESDEAALRELEGCGWYDAEVQTIMPGRPDNPPDRTPLWVSQDDSVVDTGDGGHMIRMHINAPGIDPNEPFVNLEGSFTRRQLLALIHFYPDNKEDNNAVRTTEEQREP